MNIETPKHDTGSTIVRGYSRYIRPGDDDYRDGYYYGDLEIFALSGVHEQIAEYAGTFLKKGDRILDLACGSGALCLRLSDSGFDMTGCDGLSEGFRLHGRVPFVRADLNGAFADAFSERFDAISALEILEHIENPRNFIRQCRKLLKPGGKLFLTTPNIDSLMAKAIFIRTGHFPLFSEGDYRGVGHITAVPM